MKKLISSALCAGLVLTLGACGQKKQEETPAEWTREGYFQDEDENMLSVTWMEDIDEPGWYVGCMLGEDPIEDSWGGTLPQEGNALKGTLTSSGSKEPLNVTVTEDGTDGLALAVDGGDVYHFTKFDMPEATIFITINTEGWGNIAYAEGKETPEVDEEYPYQSAVINLEKPETYTFLAWPSAGNIFVKWTKNGKDFSNEAQITVDLDETADYIAVFEEDPDWQNPVMNFVGNYESGRAHALVECFGKEEAWITIEWGSSVSELARWDINGRLDPETKTIDYSTATKTIIVFNEKGEIVKDETAYENGTGSIVFNDDGTFTWHEDQSEYDEDMVFEWVSAPEDN
ncbi:MAG: hypothetical protein Q4D46_05760 [Erysipelotrichaceae bacterium]|nr:hypothetical protein [Erysipelotrichaceae bacterium]